MGGTLRPVTNRPLGPVRTHRAARGPRGKGKDRRRGGFCAKRHREALYSAVLLVSQPRLRLHSDRGVKGRRRVTPALSCSPTTRGPLSAARRASTGVASWGPAGLACRDNVARPQFSVSGLPPWDCASAGKGELAQPCSDTPGPRRSGRRTF